MSERHYLIRRNLESFIGPMTVRDMRHAFKRMEFGLQDEVAAGFREWVTFDDVEKMKRVYPELVDLVRRDMLNGWGMMGEEEDTRLLKAQNTRASQVPGRRSSSFQQESKALNKILLVIIVVGTAALAAFLFARHGEFASKFLAPKDPQIERAREFYNAKDEVRYEAYLERYQKDILGEMQNKKGFDAWLPMLRSLAFRREGKIDGFNYKYLRGPDVSADLPKDCSKGTWQKIWRKEPAQWAAFVDGKEIPKAEWSKILLWDPAWIRRRSYNPSWFEPKSYYEGCLVMARKALTDSYAADAEKPPFYDDIASRLDWQIALVRGAQGANEITMSGTLWVLSCFESATDVSNFDECLSTVQDLNKDWDAYLRMRQSLQMLHLLTISNIVLPPGDLDLLKKNVPLIKAKDSWTRFGYEPELKFYQAVINTGGKVSDAQQQAQDKGSGIRFPE